MKYISNIVLIFSFTLVCQFLSADEGGANVGGGGYKVINGVLQLVSETSPEISSDDLSFYIESRNKPILSNWGAYDSRYNVSDETVEALKEIANQIPEIDKKVFVNYFVLSSNTYAIQKVDSFDPKMIDKIKKGYQNVSNTYDLQFAALSDSNFTYVNSEFEKLNPNQQAKLLIHEAVYRSIFKKESVFSEKLANLQLAYVMSFDVALENYLQNKTPSNLVKLYSLLNTLDFKTGKYDLRLQIDSLLIKMWFSFDNNKMVDFINFEEPEIDNTEKFQFQDFKINKNSSFYKQIKNDFGYIFNNNIDKLVAIVVKKNKQAKVNCKNFYSKKKRNLLNYSPYNKPEIIVCEDRTEIQIQLRSLLL